LAVRPDEDPPPELLVPPDDPDEALPDEGDRDAPPEYPPGDALDPEPPRE
jgi:hypothetical protein